MNGEWPKILTTDASSQSKANRSRFSISPIKRLNELWNLLGETGRQPYISQAVQERKKTESLRKIASVKKENTHQPCRFTFDYTPIRPDDEITIRPLRNGEKELPETAFIIASGELLWGQMQTVIAGSRAEGFDGNAEHVSPMVPGETIRQHVYKCCCCTKRSLEGSEGLQ